jgi:CBS domain-containing protein
VGEHVVGLERDPRAIREYSKSLLRDLRALELLLRRGAIESGVARIGAEQEMVLVDEGGHPAPIALKLLEELQHDSFTTEVGLFNLEMNLPPLRLGPDVFSTLRANLERLLAEADRAASRHGVRVILTGILPSLSHADLSLENLTPHPRYIALNQAVLAAHGSNLRLRIEGTDEFQIEHDSVSMEMCNTSFQVHLQVSAEQFALFYNVAQAMLGPTLAAAVNSPMLFGKRLWAETRIALFLQSMDARNATPHTRELCPRVRFGDRWVRESVLEIFEEDVSRFPVMMAGPVEEDSLRIVEEGGTPRLAALQLFNSTVYRWNRPCYGICDGKPHLRIECRVLPAGPSVLDQIANAALWVGLVYGGVSQYGDITRKLDFDHARANFLAAARSGLHAGFTWTDRAPVSARDLLLQRLIPLARDGLAALGVGDEGETYLDIVRRRVETGRTGAQWLLDSADRMRGRGIRAQRLAALTAATATRQRGPDPVHAWPLADLEEAGNWAANYRFVEQYMTTDLFTLNQDELLDLAAFIMDRRGIRQILVEDGEHRLVGMVSYRAILRLVATEQLEKLRDGVCVREVMDPDPVCVAADTPTLEVIRLMREHQLSAVPVLKNGKLVGIVSERDFLPMAAQLTEERLQSGGDGSGAAPGPAGAAVARPGPGDPASAA